LRTARDWRRVSSSGGAALAKKRKAQARKRVATKDLAPRNVKDVKGGRKAGPGQQEYLVVKLNDTLISG
jgi:hypothetical protein